MSDESHELLKRLFFALNCTPSQRRAIAQWRRALELRCGRPVPVENFHLTLMFLGAVEVAKIADICTVAANIRTPGVSLRVALDRLDVWRRAGVLVLAPEQAMLPFGFEESPKAFRPHLTLMRDYRMLVPESATPPTFTLTEEAR